MFLHSKETISLAFYHIVHRAILCFVFAYHLFLISVVFLCKLSHNNVQFHWNSRAVNQSSLISLYGRFNAEDSGFPKLCSMMHCLHWGK